jgi:hypothetical protein
VRKEIAGLPGLCDHLHLKDQERTGSLYCINIPKIRCGVIG